MASACVWLTLEWNVFFTGSLLYQKSSNTEVQGKSVSRFLSRLDPHDTFPVLRSQKRMIDVRSLYELKGTI